MSKNRDEPELIQRVLAGDKSAFDPLISPYKNDALKIARRMLRDPFDAEDVTQEAFLQAFLGLSSLENRERFGAWLFAIVVNLCKMRLRVRRDWNLEADWQGGRLLRNSRMLDLQPSPESIYEATELHQIVLDAVASLPGDQQSAVRMHYLEGLSLREVGLLAGVTLGAVKVRLYRARSRLRLELDQLLGRCYESTSSRGADVSMIEVIVHDVMLRAPKDDPDVEWFPGPGKKHKLGFTRVMLLKERTGERILPIWVGPTEGNTIVMLLTGVSTPRPMTLELTTKLLDLGEMKVQKIAITRLHKDTYFATMWLQVRDRISEVDARPSDAVALALRTNAPIFVAPDLLEVNQAVDPANAVLKKLDEMTQKFAEKNLVSPFYPPEETEMEWRSFRSIPRGHAPF
jgi:RNA polymerase sigma factor (sigma-70 family)